MTTTVARGRLRRAVRLLALAAALPVGAAAQNPNVPEPMLFDLVRGLGAARGELEVNALLRNDFRNPRDRFFWNPEIEYLWRDGVAFELELGMDRDRLEAVKLMTQLTFGTPLPGRYIHGAQLITERSGLDEGFDVSLLYIGALRLDQHWSLNLIQGAKYGDGLLTQPAGAYSSFLSNATLFREFKHATFGLEVNVESPRTDNPAVRIAPQLHWHRGDWALQVGLGVAASRGTEQTFGAVRLIRTLSHGKGARRYS
jgi:hypothetical protein